MNVSVTVDSGVLSRSMELSSSLSIVSESSPGHETLGLMFSDFFFTFRLALNFSVTT